MAEQATQTGASAHQALVAVERELDPAPARDLTVAERQRIDDIKASVDLTSTTAILNFGAASERAISEFADTILDQVSTRDLGPVHDKLSEIKLVAKGLSAENLKEQKGFFGRMFFDMKREVQKFSDRFATARGQVDAISNQLEDSIQEINLGLIRLDRLFEENYKNFKELNLHIQAGHELLNDAREVQLPAAEQAARDNADSPDALVYSQRARDLKAAIERLDRKVLNLEKSKAIAFASMPTIRQVQQTGIMLVEELKMAIAHAVPAWKSTMIVQIEQLKQKSGLATLNAMTDFTNEQLQNMATQLDQNATEMYEQTQRGIADADVIAETVNSLIATFDKIEKMEQEAQAARAESRGKLAEAEAALKASQAGVGA